MWTLCCTVVRPPPHPIWAAPHPPELRFTLSDLRRTLSLSCAAPVWAAPHPIGYIRVRDIRQRDIKYFAHVSQESNRVEFGRMVLSINIMLKLGLFSHRIFNKSSKTFTSNHTVHLVHPQIFNPVYVNHWIRAWMDSCIRLSKHTWAFSYFWWIWNA